MDPIREDPHALSARGWSDVQLGVGEPLPEVRLAVPASVFAALWPGASTPKYSRSRVISASRVLHDERHPGSARRRRGGLGRDPMDAPSGVDAAVTVDEGFGERGGRQPRCRARRSSARLAGSAAGGGGRRCRRIPGRRVAGARQGPVFSGILNRRPLIGPCAPEVEARAPPSRTTAASHARRRATVPGGHNPPDYPPRGASSRVRALIYGSYRATTTNPRPRMKWCGGDRHSSVIRSRRRAGGKRG